mgnify:CR=1 FL=1
MVLSNDNLGFFASYSGVIPLGMAAGYYTLQEGRNPQFTGEVIVSTEEDLSIGDLIGVGISHPCTTFDKWRVMLVVDDDYRVVDTLTTWF